MGVVSVMVAVLTETHHSGRCVGGCGFCHGCCYWPEQTAALVG